MNRYWLQTIALISVVSECAAFLHNVTARHLAGEACSALTPCGSPEICAEGDTCERSDQQEAQGLQCPWYRDPAVVPISEEAIKRTALANSPGGKPISITQESFATGDFQISRSGYYKFVEDIVIPYVPRPLEVAPPRHLGQTIGLRIVASDVVIDLNGHVLEMADDLRKHEGFMTLIQLNNNNFPDPLIGFDPLFSAHRVLIFSSAKKGTLKKSTHFGISGILNSGVIIKNLDILQCEIGGISITDARNVHIENVLVDNTDLVVPFTAFYGVVLQLRRRLLQIIDLVKQDAIPGREPLDVWESRLAVVNEHIDGADSNYLANPTPDRPMGNSFGIQIKSLFNILVKRIQDGAESVHIVRTTVKNIRVGPSDVVSVEDDTEFEEVLKDLDSNVYEWTDFFEEDGTPKTCPLSIPKCFINDLRIKSALYLCDAPLQKQPIGTLCQEGLQKLVNNTGVQNLKPRRHRDIRNHPPVGAFGVRFVGVKNSIVEDVVVYGVENSDVGAKIVSPVSDIRKSPVVWRALEDEFTVFENGHCAFGFFCEFCTTVTLKKVTAQKINSTNGLAIAVGVGSRSDDVLIDNVSAHVATPAPQEPSPNNGTAAFNMPFYIGENDTQCVHMVNLMSLGKANSIRIVPAPREITVQAPEETATTVAPQAKKTSIMRILWILVGVVAVIFLILACFTVWFTFLREDKAQKAQHPTAQEEDQEAPAPVEEAPAERSPKREFRGVRDPARTPSAPLHGAHTAEERRVRTPNRAGANPGERRGVRTPPSHSSSVESARLTSQSSSDLSRSANRERSVERNKSRPSPQPANVQKKGAHGRRPANGGFTQGAPDAEIVELEGQVRGLERDIAHQRGQMQTLRSTLNRRTLD